METQQVAYLLLSSIVRQLPEIIVLIIGLVWCFSNRAKYPKAGKIALGGLFILLASRILGTAIFLLQVYLPVWYRDSYQTFSYINFAVGILFSIVSAAGLGLIIYAVWAERDGSRLNS